ncbi:uncharacterized protein LOC141665208 [Apium graveolens]|uniref:uncharacterized protein LOC141665208 n=1 Tax=Apium graveolens TaxID=4045 RepID=UPI003D7AC6FD
MVDSMAGHEFLTFLDASSGFNQIQMESSDCEKIIFITDNGIYCYLAIPFGLRNAGATFQRLDNKMFKDQIENCLGHMVTRRGIEASPEQIKAIFKLKSPLNVKDVQKLTGRVAALNRFISRSSDRCMFFYDVLRKNKGFIWSEKHEVALHGLKTYLTTPPLLSKPFQGEDFYVYGPCKVLALNQHDDSTNEDVDSWIRVYKDYLQLGFKLNRNNEVRILRMKASRFTVIDNELFKKSSTGLLQRCLRKHKADMPFMKWGMDIVGKMMPAHGQKVFMLAMTDYFSKWIEAEAFKQVMSKEVISFIKRNIFCKFGVPFEIVCDNGSQFISDKTEAFCKHWNINLIKSKPRYPQANGQAELSNKIIINNFKGD